MSSPACCTRRAFVAWTAAVQEEKANRNLDAVREALASEEAESQNLRARLDQIHVSAVTFGAGLGCVSWKSCYWLGPIQPSQCKGWSQHKFMFFLVLPDPPRCVATE